MKTLEDVLRETLTNKFYKVVWKEETNYGVWDAIDEAINEIDFNEDYDDIKRDRDCQKEIVRQLNIINSSYRERIEDMKCCGNCDSWETDECIYSSGAGYCCKDWTPFVEKSAARLAFEKTYYFKNAIDDHQRSDRWMIFEEGYNANKESE